MTRIDRPIDSDSDSEPSTRAYTARIPSMASAGRSKTQLKSKRKPKILFYTRPNAPPEALSQLKDVVEMVVIQPGDYETSKRRIQEAVEEHGDFEAFVFTFPMGNPDAPRTGWGKDLLGPLAPACGCYFWSSVGYDAIDADWVTSTGAYLANNPREIGLRTADGTVMLILTVLRGYDQQVASARAGHFRDSSLRAFHYGTATIGILGMGNIGQRVAELCSAFGMKVIYNNRHELPHSKYDYVDLDTLYSRADVLVILAPLTEETRGMINDESIGKMKDGVMVVNVARGAIIDTEALLRGLDSGKILRAALDVYEHEPNIDPRLREHSNVTTYPHSICSTQDLMSANGREMAENVLAYVRTGKPNTPVNYPAGRD